jgi:nitroreductase
MSIRPKILEALRYAAMAPSGHNAQPWTFVMEEDGVAVFPDLTRRLPVADPDDRELWIGLGSALENLVIAARHTGLAPRVEYFPPTHASALMVHFGAEEREGTDDAALFAAIPARHVTRRAYDGRPIPAEQLATLAGAAVGDGVSVHTATLGTQIDAIAALVEEATRVQFKSGAFLAELASWVRFNKREAHDATDGLSYKTLGRMATPRWLGATFLRRLTSAGREAKRAGRLVPGSSAVLVFSARHADPRHWVEVGRTFERVALTATALGLRHAHASAACEVVGVRRKLQEYLGLGQAEPLLVVRLGYARPRPISRRRPLEEMVVRRPVKVAATPSG